MSVIAWDGETLAADRRFLFSGTLIRTGPKISRVNNCLVGYTGSIDAGECLLHWFRSGKEPEKFPEIQKDEQNAQLLVITPSKSIMIFERTPHPTILDNQHFAIGRGQDFAMAAMYLGKTAEEAVAVACALDSTCGNGIDVLR